jgi:hypothetical protein
MDLFWWSSTCIYAILEGKSRLHFFSVCSCGIVSFAMVWELHGVLVLRGVSLLRCYIVLHFILDFLLKFFLWCEDWRINLVCWFSCSSCHGVEF